MSNLWPCAPFTPITSCCRCRRDTSSRWPGTRACASASSPRASSRRMICTRRRWRMIDDLRLVHAPEYVDAVVTGTVPHEIQRRIGFPWSPQMVERSRRSVGATIAAAHAALDDGVAANLAGGTHHAFADRGEGFCVFNDVAVAARVLQRDQLRARIAIVDLDVHQGNGTAAIFSGDASVFTFSMHGDKNFPFKKEAERSGRASRRRHRRRRSTCRCLQISFARRPEPAPARLRLLSSGCRSVRRRSARPHQDDDRRAAAPRCDRVGSMHAGAVAGRDLHERRLRQRHRRHRHHSREYEYESPGTHVISTFVS